MKVPSSLMFATWRPNSWICRYIACVKWNAHHLSCTVGNIIHTAFQVASSKSSTIRFTWRCGRMTYFLVNRHIVRLSTARHYTYCHRQLLHTPILWYKCVYCKELVEWMSDGVKCRVHVPGLGLGQGNYLDVRCKEKMLRPFNIDITSTCISRRRKLSGMRSWIISKFKFYGCGRRFFWRWLLASAAILPFRIRIFV